MKEFLIKFRKFFNRKQFKYGGYAFLMTVGVIAVVLLVNLLFSKLDDTFNLSADLTASQIYSLTSSTEHILETLDTDVYIYTLYTDDYEDDTVSELLDRYRKGSDYIHVENINLTTSPGKVDYYVNEKDQDVSTGGIIVSTSSDPNDTTQSFKVMDYYDLYSYDSDEGAYTLFTGEDAITGAINYVINPDIPKVWFLEGHGATSSSNWSEIASTISDENYEVSSLTLLDDTDTLEKGDILIVDSPSIDLSNDEREVLLEFALDGGKIIFFFNPETVADLPNFMLILSHYNISISDGIVIEDADNAGAYLYSPYYLVPEYGSHDITSALVSASISTMYPYTGAIEVGPEQSGIEVEVLLESSDQAYLEPLTSDMDGEMDEGAETGPFTLAVAVTKDADDDYDEVQMIVTVSSISFEALSSMPTTGNEELLLNMVSWLNPSEDDFYIRGKSLQTSILYFDSSAQIWTIGIIILLIPIAAIVAAVVVYLRRRHL